MARRTSMTAGAVLRTRIAGRRVGASLVALSLVACTGTDARGGDDGPAPEVVGAWTIESRGRADGATTTLYGDGDGTDPRIIIATDGAVEVVTDCTTYDGTLPAGADGGNLGLVVRATTPCNEFGQDVHDIVMTVLSNPVRITVLDRGLFVLPADGGPGLGGGYGLAARR